MKPYSRVVHWTALFLFVCSLPAFYFSAFQSPQHPMAAADYTCTFDGSVSNDWNVAGNWDAGAGCNGEYPGQTSNTVYDVIIPAGTTASLNVADLNLNNDINTSTGSISVSGTLTTNNNNITFGSLNIIAGGTVTPGSSTLTVYDDWSNGGTFTHGTSTVVFGGGETSLINSGGTSETFDFNVITLSGSTTLTAQTNGLKSATINVTSGALDMATNDQTLEVTGTLTITNAQSYSTGTAMQTIGTLTNSGNITCESSSEYISISVFTGSNAGWWTYTKNTGTVNVMAATYSDIAFNDSGGDAIFIMPNGTTNLTRNLTVTGGTVAIGSNTVNVTRNVFANDVITISTGTLDVDGNTGITGTGTITCTGTSTINIKYSWIVSNFIAGNSTVTFDGSSGQGITSSNTWYNLTIINTAGTPSDTTDVDPAAAQTVTNNLTVTDGQYTPFTGDIYKNVSIGASGIIKPDGLSNINVSGNWANAGTFTHNTGTVTFNGTTEATISGFTTFRNLTFDTSSGEKQVNITAGTTQYIQLGGILTLSGQDASHTLLLRSTSSPTKYTFSISTDISSVNYVDVQDNAVVGGVIYSGNGTTVTNCSGWDSSGTYTISGHIYNNLPSEGGAEIMAPKNVAVSINGDAPQFDMWTIGGYSIPTSELTGNDIITVYVDGDSVQASAVTKISALGDISIDLYQNYTIVRHETGTSSFTSSDLAIADNTYDSDMLFSVNSSNVSTFQKEIYIPSSKNYVLSGTTNIIGSIANAGTISVGDYTLSASTIRGGAVHIGAGTINTSGQISGSVVCDGASKINIGGHWMVGSFTPSTSTVTFNGSINSVIAIGNTWYNLVITNPLGVSATGNQIVLNDLIVNTGEFRLLYLNQWNIFNHQFKNVSIETNGSIKPDNEVSISVSGNWSNAGTFISSTGTFTFNGTGDSTISGFNIFNNLTMDASVDGAKTIYFAEGRGNTIRVSGTWTLNGTSGKVLTLRSSKNDSPWYFYIPADFTSGGYIDVKDSYAAYMYKITPGTNVVNSGNNDGWNFTKTSPTTQTTPVTETLTTPTQANVPEKSAIDNLVEELQNSPVAQAIASVAEKITQVTAAIGLLPLVANIVGGLPAALHAINYGFSLTVEALGIRRRRKSWGRVYDSTTGKGVDTAVIRLYDQQDMTLKGTMITDIKGKYYFSADPGVYAISVSKDGYIFPTEIFAKYGIQSFNKKASRNNTQYVGQPINIDDKTNYLNIDVPMDPVKPNISTLFKIKIFGKDLFNYFLVGLPYIVIPALIIGSVLSIFTAVVRPTQYNIILSIVYVTITAIYILSRYLKSAHAGMVLDKTTKQPIPGVMISLFEKEHNNLKETRITDRYGRFSINAPKGKYYLKAQKSGYTFTISGKEDKDIILKEANYIRKTIDGEKKR